MSERYEKIELGKFLSISVVGLMIASMLITGIVDPLDNHSLDSSNTPLELNYEIHQPIRINNESDFEEQAVEEGWNGTGTQNDPYIIEGYEIDGDSEGSCIYIGNTTDYFTIKNCLLINASGNTDQYWKNSGLYLYNITNGRVDNNTLKNNGWRGLEIEGCIDTIVANNTVKENDDSGIYVESSDNSTLKDNTISNHPQLGVLVGGSSSRNKITKNNISLNGNGIQLNSASTYNSIDHNDVSDSSWNGIHLLYESNNNTILSNEISYNGETGIYLEEVANNTLQGNIMKDDSILITSDKRYHWNTHVIETNNTVNGAPVYYWKNKTSGTVPTDAGEVILANCTDVQVEELKVNNGSVGILLGHSDNNTVINNTASGNDWFGIAVFNSTNNSIWGNYNGPGNFYGMYVSESISNDIYDNEASSNEDGIKLIDSKKNNVTNNTLSLNSRYGIILESSTENILEDNMVEDNDDGIRLYSYSNRNRIEDNIVNSNKEGIFLKGFCENNRLSNNSAYGNKYGIYLDMSDSNTVVENNITEWNEYGIYLTYSDDNQIYHNNILLNEVNGFDDGVNWWNDSYPKGGNYWGDYSGYDNYSGPDQDEPGWDGIGDSNYTINGGSNADEYPLMFPTYAEDTYSLNLTADDLSDGWQFISLPIEPHNKSLEDVLKYINGSYDKVMYYDSATDQWETYAVERDDHYNSIGEIDLTMGFWVHMTRDDTLVVGGDEPVSTDITLEPGWNMVGYPSDTDRTASDTLPQEVSKIGVFNASREYNFQYIYDLTKVTMKAGNGYWIYNSADSSVDWNIDY